MRLKNHDSYFNKILDYANSIGVTIYFYKDLDSAHYESHGKKVYIDPKYKNSDLIAYLLHEIGHFEDDLYTSSKTVEKLYVLADKKSDKGIPLSDKEYNCIIQCEKNAWYHGAIIARKLKIPLGKWYKKIEKESLLTYQKIKRRK